MSFSNFQTIMDRIGLLTIEVQEPVSIEEIGPLAQFAATHKLTTYDAAYLQLAIQCGIPLATLDRAMRTAATSLNIAIIPPAP